MDLRPLLLKHPDPVDDPFYQSTVKSMIYFCAAILLLVKLFSFAFLRRSYFFPLLFSHISLVSGSRYVPMQVRYGRILNNSFIRWSCQLIEFLCTINWDKVLLRLVPPNVHLRITVKSAMRI